MISSPYAQAALNRCSLEALCCPHEHEQASGQLVSMKRMQVL